MSEEYLIVSREDFFERISLRLSEGIKILEFLHSSSENLYPAQIKFRDWDLYNKEYLRTSFSIKENRHLKKYSTEAFGHSIYRYQISLGAKEKADLDDLNRNLHRKTTYLKDILNLKEFIISKPNMDQRTSASTGTKVFIVHGHDDLARNAVENLVMTLGLQPIILMNRPNNGDTIIEKFEREADTANPKIRRTGGFLSAADNWG